MGHSQRQSDLDALDLVARYPEEVAGGDIAALNPHWQMIADTASRIAAILFLVKQSKGSLSKVL